MNTEQNALEAYRELPVLVTGVTGFVGRWVARLLSQAGAQLSLIARDANALSNVCQEYEIQGQQVCLDVGDLLGFREAYETTKPAITFNCVGYGVDRAEKDEPLTWKINSQVVQGIAQTIADVGSTPWDGLSMVHIGSAFEFGPIDGVVSDEAKPKPETVYGQSKLDGTMQLQKLCQQTGLRGATARLFTVYGPGEHDTRLLPSLMRAARLGEPVELTQGKQERDFTYVQDAAQGLLRLGLSKAASGQVFNLSTGELVSVRSFVETAAKLLGIKPKQLRLGAIPYRPDELWQCQADVSRFEQLVGWKPRCTVAQGISQAIEFQATCQSVSGT